MQEGFEPSWSSIGRFVHMIQSFILLTEQMLRVFFYCLLVFWFCKCCWFSLCWISLCVISAWKFLVHAVSLFVKNIPNEDNQCSSGLSSAVVGSANGSVKLLYQW